MWLEYWRLQLRDGRHVKAVLVEDPSIERDPIHCSNSVEDLYERR